MEPFVIMMIAGGAVFVIFSIITVINFGLMMKKGMSFDFKSLGLGVMLHLGGGFLAGAGLLSLIAGFIWFLADKYA